MRYQDELDEHRAREKSAAREARRRKRVRRSVFAGALLTVTVALILASPLQDRLWSAVGLVRERAGDVAEQVRERARPVTAEKLDAIRNWARESGQREERVIVFTRFDDGARQGLQSKVGQNPSHEELVLYMLELINKDRAAHGLSPVRLGNNPAAQQHAEEIIHAGYFSHWGLRGEKPYMRYTFLGGVNYEGENIGSLWLEGASHSISLQREIQRGRGDEILEGIEQGLMNSPGHQRNILDKWHRKVNIGLAYNEQRVAIVQQFEGDYVEFNIPPTIVGTDLTMSGILKLGALRQLAIYYDPPLQPLSPQQLESPPYDYSYDLGRRVGRIHRPAPPGSFYVGLEPGDIEANKWQSGPDGSFRIKANIAPVLAHGRGIYTVIILSETSGEIVGLTRYSLVHE